MEMNAADLSLLQAKFARLTQLDSSEISPAGRLISAKGLGPRLEAILTEIDDTLLGETLTFHVGAAQIAMTVSGRRLLGFIDASGFAVPDGILGTTLSPEDTELMDATQVLMSSFAGIEGRIYLTVGAPTKIGTGATVGASIAQLRTSWTPLASVEDSDDQTPPNAFLSRLEGKIIAMLHVQDGAVISHVGPDDHVAALSEIHTERFKPFAAARAANVSTHANPSLTCLLGAGPDDTALIIAVRDGGITLLTVAAKDAAKVHQFWREVDQP